jgi:hypothetical protein
MSARTHTSFLQPKFHTQRAVIALAAATARKFPASKYRTIVENERHHR